MFKHSSYLKSSRMIFLSFREVKLPSGNLNRPEDVDALPENASSIVYRCWVPCKYWDKLTGTRSGSSVF